MAVMLFWFYLKILSVLSEVFSTIKFDEDKKSFMFILNDYGPDSKKIFPWIWDAYFKEIANTQILINFTVLEQELKK